MTFWLAPFSVLTTVTLPLQSEVKYGRGRRRGINTQAIAPGNVTPLDVPLTVRFRVFPGPGVPVAVPLQFSGGVLGGVPFQVHDQFAL